MSDVNALAETVRGFFGDCDCRAVGRAEHEDYSRCWAEAESALDGLVEAHTRQEAALKEIAALARFEDEHTASIYDLDAIARAALLSPSERGSGGQT